MKNTKEEKMKATDDEVFNEWVSLNGYDKTDPVEDPEYRKAMMGSLSFQRFLVGQRVRECIAAIKNSICNN